jgi:hypothetical protein
VILQVRSHKVDYRAQVMETPHGWRATGFAWPARRARVRSRLAARLPLAAALGGFRGLEALTAGSCWAALETSAWASARTAASSASSCSLSVRTPPAAAIDRTGSWSIRAPNRGHTDPTAPRGQRRPRSTPPRRRAGDPHGFARQPPRPAARSASLNTSRRKHPIRASRDRELWADLDDS